MITIILMYDTANNWPGYVVHRPPFNISLFLQGKEKKVLVCIYVLSTPQ